jgi:hypothetical protein
MPHIQLYDKRTISQFAWPDHEEGQYAKGYLLPLLQEQTDRWIANTKTILAVLSVDDRVIPLTINEQEYENSYVCSPYTHYVSYARQELSLLNNRPVEMLLSAMLAPISLILKASRFNKTVHVNNWLLSTNLYPSLTESQVEEVLAFLQAAYPQHTLVFRSLNKTTNDSLLEALKQRGCMTVPSRQVYMLDPQARGGASSKARWLIKRDFELIQKHGYEIVKPNDLSEADMPRLVELYNLLYLDKYSLYNPQFSERFFALAWRERLLQLYALRNIKSGRIDAVLGSFSRNGVMTTPVFGYDTALPKELGLYRMLSAVLVSLAREQGCLLHESSGAAQFKRNRGATSDIEYSAVFHRHLPLYRKVGWTLLYKVLQRVGVPLMRKYKF